MHPDIAYSMVRIPRCSKDSLSENKWIHSRPATALDPTRVERDSLPCEPRFLAITSADQPVKQPMSPTLVSFWLGHDERRGSQHP